MRIFAAIHRLRFGNLAVFILFPTSWQSTIDDIAIAAEYRYLHAGNRDDVARMRDNVFVLPCSQYLLVCLPDIKSGSRLGVNVHAVIDKSANRDPLHQLWNTT